MWLEGFSDEVFLFLDFLFLRLGLHVLRGFWRKGLGFRVRWLGTWTLGHSLKQVHKVCMRVGNVASVKDRLSGVCLQALNPKP